MLGFELDFWDYATFATFALAGAAAILAYIWLAGLPGRIAIARKHPDAEAVKLCAAVEPEHAGVDDAAVGGVALLGQRAGPDRAASGEF
jgi:hypothetical protein